MPRDARSGSEHGPPPPTSRWEWVAAAVGALLLLGTVGFLVYEAVTTQGPPLPRLSVQVDTVVGHGAHHLVQIVVRNDGSATAAEVVIEGALRSDTGSVETRETTIDFVPPKSQRRGGLVFAADPRRHAIELRPVAYRQP